MMFTDETAQDGHKLPGSKPDHSRQPANGTPPLPPRELRFIKLGEVVTMCAKSRSSVYADVRKGTFLAPVKTGGHGSAWILGEIIDWMASRTQARGSAVPAAGSSPDHESDSPVAAS